LLFLSYIDYVDEGNERLEPAQKPII